MLFKKLDLVRWMKKDDWWLVDCPLEKGKVYRITDVQKVGDITGYFIHGWWVQQGGHAYIIQHEFKVGDRVRVALRVENEIGWNLVWVPTMDEYVGKEYTITEIQQGSGVYFVEDGAKYGFPPSCLEPV